MQTPDFLGALSTHYVSDRRRFASDVAGFAFVFLGECFATDFLGVRAGWVFLSA
jgi:hypothetical protein